MYIIKSIFPIKKAGGNRGNPGNPGNRQPQSASGISSSITLGVPWLPRLPRLPHVFISEVPSFPQKSRQVNTIFLRTG